MAGGGNEAKKGCKRKREGSHPLVEISLSEGDRHHVRALRHTVPDLFSGARERDHRDEQEHEVNEQERQGRGREEERDRGEAKERVGVRGVRARAHLVLFEGSEGVRGVDSS